MGPRGIVSARGALVTHAACAVAAALAVGATPAGAAVRTLAPASTFRAQVERIKAATDVPVLLPSRIAVDVPRGHRLHAVWSAHTGGWTLSLQIGRRCGGANACAVGFFGAERGGTPAFRRTVWLRGGVRGWFKPLTCGASCSPPQIQWRLDGVRYDAQVRLAGPGGDRARLVRLANSALAAGPR